VWGQQDKEAASSVSVHVASPPTTLTYELKRNVVLRCGLDSVRTGQKNKSICLLMMNSLSQIRIKPPWSFCLE
jgi:hypothetical protein